MDQPSAQVSTSTLVSDPGSHHRVLFFEPALLKRIVSLGFPVIIGMLTQTAINQVDTLFVGRLDEKVAVAGTAALGFSLILLWAFGGFLSAISVGTQAMTARRYGAGDIEGAGKVLTNSVALAICSSVIVTIVAIAIDCTSTPSGVACSGATMGSLPTETRASRCPSWGERKCT